jgi:hypothetical protein
MQIWKKRTIIFALEYCLLNPPLRRGFSLNLSSFLRSTLGLGFLRLGKKFSPLQAPLQIYDNVLNIKFLLRGGSCVNDLSVCGLEFGIERESRLNCQIIQENVLVGKNRGSLT